VPVQISMPMDKIEAFCRKWKVQRMWLFGSALRDDFGPESDVDVLVEFAPEARWNLLDLAGAEQELSAIMGRPADLVERQCVERSENWIRRRHILESARMIYVAR
jgi:predicted nucleotidyltransferase